jgi:hypothetical protein
MAVLGAWLVSVIVLFFVLRAIVNALLGPVQGVGVLVLIVVAVAVAQPLTFLAERLAMQRLPSGRAAHLERGRLRWNDKGRSVDLDLNQIVNYWRWKFEVRQRRSGRVPTGHQCLAIRLVQTDSEISLYAFLPPEKASAITRTYPFYELRRANDKAGKALGGRDAIFLAAEHARWESGAELDAADFQALLAHLDAHLPDFRASSTTGG